MRLKHLLIFLILLHMSYTSVFPQLGTGPAVTYSLDASTRLGNALLNYIKALFISCKYKVPLLYKPFPYSDQLTLSKINLHTFNSESLKNHSKVIHVGHDYTFMQYVFKELEKAEITGNNNLYDISFFAPFWEAELDNEEFRKILIDHIKPLIMITPLNIPNNCISIAVHVRSRNNTFDTQHDIDTMPSLFPPHYFYINGLKQIINHFKERSLYIYIFTDDPNPVAIKERYLKALRDYTQHAKIVIECRTSENTHYLNILEDFFGIMQFDCLINPNSTFSKCAALVSGPIIQITTPNWINISPEAWNAFTITPENEYRRDKNGNIIIDNKMIIRETKGGKITQVKIIEADCNES